MSRKDSDKERYHRYLNSREWAELRRKVQERCGGKCERCKNNTMSHVHHLTYIRKYQECLEDLQGLCVGCHDFIHARSDVDPALASDPTERTATESFIDGCAVGFLLANGWRLQEWKPEPDGSRSPVLCHPDFGSLVVQGFPWGYGFGDEKFATDFLELSRDTQKGMIKYIAVHGSYKPPEEAD